MSKIKQEELDNIIDAAHQFYGFARNAEVPKI